MERLNNSKVYTYSPTLNLDVTLLPHSAAATQKGLKYSDQALKGFTIVDTPFTDVDLFSLPDGIIALLPYRTVRCPRKRGKHTKFNVYNSASQAAYLIDGKVEFKYIERYIIVNKLVQTSARSFYFVNRPDFIANTSQFKTNIIKGAKVQIITLDPRYNIHVKFNSKAEVSEFLGGVARLALLRPVSRFR